MYKYQETQENKFGQLTSFSVEHFKSCELVRGNIEGNYVNLIDINSEVSNRNFPKFGIVSQQSQMKVVGPICRMPHH